MTQAIEGFLQALTAGLLIGAVYGLMCVGLGLIFGVMRVINFAQGDFMMLGMYAAFYLFTAFGIQATFGNTRRAVRRDPAGGSGARGLRLCHPSGPDLSRLRHPHGRARGRRSLRPAHSHAGDRAGAAERRLDRLRLGAGLDPHAVVEFRPGSSARFSTCSVFINKARGIDAVLSFATMTLLTLLITRSRLGKSLRAAADNPTAATYMGIDVDRAHRIAFALGTGITAIAGGLLATNYPFHPFVGLEYVIVMYAGVVLGGMGSIIGAFWGGMTIGLVQQMSTLVLPTQLQNAAIFVVFLLIIFFRPQGFFGRMVERT